MKHYHIISRIAIFMLSLVLIAFGVFHFMHPKDLIVYIPLSLSGGLTWVYVVGSAFILVGLSYLTNQLVKLTSYVLFGLLVFFILAIHLPNYLNAADAEYRQVALLNIIKDTAIAAFALHIAATSHHQHFNLDQGD
jgi:uncharacterized membrane protein